MAVAFSDLKAQQSRFIRRQKPILLKFFGRCEMPDGSVKFLVAKAPDAVEASRKLHKGYQIACVLDIITVAGMEKYWDRLKPSLIQRSLFK